MENNLNTSNSDPVLRARILLALDSGLTLAELARGSGVNRAIVSQYADKSGNKYPGDVSKYERRLVAYLDRRDLEVLDGIPTIETAVSKNIFAAARMAQRCHLMVKCIGRAGIGKTRGAALLAQTDETALVFECSRARGTLEGVRKEIYRLAGIRGPKRGEKSQAKYAALVKKLRGTEILIVIDQAHMLGSAAIDFFCELWNATKSPQLWLGTDKLTTKVARDEQWSSRLHATFPLEVVIDKERNDVRDLVRHQIKSRLPELNGELNAITRLCEGLAKDGNFRTVENHLAMMLWLRDSDEFKATSWPDLFEAISYYLSPDYQEAA